MYCYSNNGLSMRAVAADYSAQDGEVLFASIPDSGALADAFPGYAAGARKASTIAQIEALEAGQTARRVRGAIAGNAEDAAWLASLESQIAALRAQL